MPATKQVIVEGPSLDFVREFLKTNKWLVTDDTKERIQAVSPSGQLRTFVSDAVKNRVQVG